MAIDKKKEVKHGNIFLANIFSILQNYCKYSISFFYPLYLHTNNIVILNGKII